MSMRAEERSKLLNTLAILLKGLEGRVTTIELRNESSVRGHIVYVDYLMNTTLKDAVMLAPNGRQLMACDDFFVKGTNIRYVQIPDDINITKTIEEQTYIAAPAEPGRRPPKLSGEERKKFQQQQRKEKRDAAVETMKAALAQADKS